MRLYHITTGAAWEDARRSGIYAPDSLRSEGFIHLSTGEQWRRVLVARFNGARDLVLLDVDSLIVASRLRWENTEGGEELFPHLYGTLDPSVVISVQTLST